MACGAAGGWAATRAIGGQSPLTALNVTTISVQTALQHPFGTTIPVPLRWTPYTDDPPGGSPSVTYVSPDRTEELVVRRAPSVAVAQETAGAEVVEPAAATPTGPPGSVSLAFRTADRTSWRRVVPAGAQAWSVTFTVPRSAAGRLSKELFTSLSGQFSPPP